MSGESLDLKNPKEILKINSPQPQVGGPYVVVYVDDVDRWAIVAMDWDGEPRLGLRWFWGNSGNPMSNTRPTWLVVPSKLSKSILSGLPLHHNVSNRIDQFLAGNLSSKDLVLSIDYRDT